MVLRRDNSRTDRSKDWVELRRGSAKRTSTWRTSPQTRHSTRGIGRTTRVFRLPMGRVRNWRSQWPREMTAREPQAEQRQSWGGIVAFRGLGSVYEVDTLGGATVVVVAT